MILVNNKEPYGDPYSVLIRKPVRQSPSGKLGTQLARKFVFIDIMVPCLTSGGNELIFGTDLQIGT